METGTSSSIRQETSQDQAASDQTSDFKFQNFPAPSDRRGIPRGGRDDYWVVLDNTVLRVHVRPRRSLFVPTEKNTGGEGEPRLSDLGPVRTTRVKYFRSEDTSVHTRSDMWLQLHPRLELPDVWIGETEFALGSQELGQAVPVLAKTVPVPPGLSLPNSGTSSRKTSTPSGTRTSQGQDFADTLPRASARVHPPGNTSVDLQNKQASGENSGETDAILEFSGDYWEHRGRTWIRYHRMPRNLLCQPDEGLGGPDPRTLLPTRHTTKVTEDGNIVELTDDWTTYDQTAASSGSAGWAGHTVFETRGLYPATYEHDVTDAALEAKPAGLPKQPTEQERELHNLTHLPFRSWCPICVQSRSKTNPHKTLPSITTPLLQADYGFLVDRETREEFPVLTCIDVTTGLATSTVVQAKGVNNYALAELRRFIHEVGRTTATLQTDQETSIRAGARTCHQQPTFVTDVARLLS